MGKQERGFLKIEDPVYKYIKAFDTPDKKGITIRHLLTHTAGLYEWYPLYYRASNKEESYKLIGELPLMFPVGAQRHYSDLGFIILGEIVETISGLALEKFMQQNIFLPLKMKSTTYNPLTTGNFKKIATTSHGNPYEKRMVYDSTLGFKIKEIDPVQWTGWRTYILQIFLTKDNFNNGLGWMMDPENSFMKNGPDETFGHTGFTGPSISVIPKYGLSVILLINRQNTGLLKTGDYYNVNPIRLQVFNALLKYQREITGQ